MCPPHVCLRCESRTAAAPLVPEKRKMQATFTLGQSLPPQLLHGSCQQLMSILQKARSISDACYFYCMRRTDLNSCTARTLPIL
jgi:hypothetical protein